MLGGVGGRPGNRAPIPIGLFADVFRTYRPNPRVNPQDHLRRPQVGHRRRQYVNHSINSIKALSIIAETNNAMKPTIIISRTISRAHHPSPVELFDSIAAGALLSRDRTNLIDGISMAAQTPICTSKSMPHDAVGRTPRDSSY